MVAFWAGLDRLPRYGRGFPRHTYPWAVRDPSRPRPSLRSGEPPWISDITAQEGHEGIKPEHIAGSIDHRSLRLVTVRAAGPYNA